MRCAPGQIVRNPEDETSQDLSREVRSIGARGIVAALPQIGVDLRAPRIFLFRLEAARVDMGPRAHERRRQPNTARAHAGNGRRRRAATFLDADACFAASRASAAARSPSAVRV